MAIVCESDIKVFLYVKDKVGIFEATISDAKGLNSNFSFVLLVKLD